MVLLYHPIKPLTQGCLLNSSPRGAFPLYMQILFQLLKLARKLEDVVLPPSKPHNRQPIKIDVVHELTDIAIDAPPNMVCCGGRCFLGFRS